MREAFRVFDPQSGDYLYKCNICNQRKLVDEFSPSSLNFKRHRCKQCNVETTRKYRSNNPFAQVRFRLSSRESRRGTPLSREIAHEDIRALFVNEFGEDGMYEAINTYSLERLDPEEPWSLSNNMFTRKNTRPHPMFSNLNRNESSSETESEASVSDSSSSSFSFSSSGEEEKQEEEEEPEAPLKKIKYVFEIEEEEEKV